MTNPAQRVNVRDAFSPGMNILVYHGKLHGKVSDKRKVFLGRVGGLVRLEPNKKYGVRIRGRDRDGTRIIPICCHGRTDSEGELWLPPGNLPMGDFDMHEDPPPPEEPPEPPPGILSDVMKNIMRSTPTRRGGK